LQLTLRLFYLKAIDILIRSYIDFSGTKMNKKVKFMDVSFLFRGIGWPFVIQKLNWRKKVVTIENRHKNEEFVSDATITFYRWNQGQYVTLNFQSLRNAVNAFFGVYSQITIVESLFFSTQYLFVLKFTICLDIAVTETIFGFNLNIVPIKCYLHKFTKLYIQNYYIMKNILVNVSVNSCLSLACLNAVIRTNNFSLLKSFFFSQ